MDFKKLFKKIKSFLKDNYGKLIIFIILLYFLIFVIIRPFSGSIVEDSPITAFFCELQVRCHVGNTTTFTCESNTLKNWKLFNGCNNKTPGYNQELNRITDIDYCSCGGLQ